MRDLSAGVTFVTVTETFFFTDINTGYSNWEMSQWYRIRERHRSNWQSWTEIPLGLFSIPLCMQGLN